MYQNFAASASLQASLVLPGAKSTLASRPKHGNRVHKLTDGNRVLLEPYKTPRDNEKFFKWNSKEPTRGSDSSRTTARADGWRSARPSTSQGYERAYPSSRIGRFSSMSYIDICLFSLFIMYPYFVQRPQDPPGAVVVQPVTGLHFCRGRK